VTVAQRRHRLPLPQAVAPVAVARAAEAEPVADVVVEAVARLPHPKPPLQDCFWRKATRMPTNE
jgi:hypothetical protein